MIKKFIREKNKYLRLRYEKLYGKGDYQKYFDKDRNESKKQFLILGIMMLTMIALSIYSDISGKPYIKEGKDREMVRIARPGKGEGSAVIDAKIWAKSGKNIVSIDKKLILESVGSKRGSENEVIGSETKEDILERKIAQVTRDINKDTSGKEVILPQVLEDGTRIFWQEKHKNYYGIIFLGIGMWLIFVLATQSNRIKKEEERARVVVIKEIPEFINKLVLLMEGGVVMQEAFDRIVADREKRGMADNYFYSQLSIIRLNVANTNSIMSKELLEFAKRSGIKEMMRFASIISDSSIKGADVAEYLKKEGRILWFERKKQSEKEGRIAESKLTFPLMILVMVLVMITVAPAMMSM